MGCKKKILVSLVVAVMASAGCEKTETANAEEPDQEVIMESLERWLQEQDTQAVLQVPIGLEITPLGVKRAWVIDGGSADQEAGLVVRLDDSRLGVSVADRARSLCDDDTCKIWVRARVGPAMPGLPTSEEQPVLTVISVEGLITEATPAISVEQ